MEIFGIIILAVIVVFMVVVLVVDLLAKPNIKGVRFLYNRLCLGTECETQLTFTVDTYRELSVTRRPEDGETTTTLVSFVDDAASGTFASRTERVFANGGYEFTISMTTADLPSLSRTYIFTVHAQRALNVSLFGASVMSPWKVQASTYLDVRATHTHSAVFAEKVGKVYGLDENGQNVVVGVEKFETSQTVSGPSATDQGYYRFCSDAQLSQVRVSNIGVSFDEKFADQYSDSDATRQHPQLVRVRVSRDGDPLREEILGEGGVLDFAPALEVDGSSAVEVYSAMECGPEGPFQEGFQITWKLEFDIACPG